MSSYEERLGIIFVGIHALSQQTNPRYIYYQSDWKGFGGRWGHFSSFLSELRLSPLIFIVRGFHARVYERRGNFWSNFLSPRLTLL